MQRDPMTPSNDKIVKDQIGAKLRGNFKLARDAGNHTRKTTPLMRFERSPEDVWGEEQPLQHERPMPEELGTKKCSP